MFSEREFDEALDTLYDFCSQLKAKISTLKDNAQTCVLNMEDDVIAKNASDNLISILDSIEDIIDDHVKPLMEKLDEEKERALKIANYDDE